MRIIRFSIILIILLLPATILQADACSGAPPPRLRPEMAGVVAPGLQGLRLRALPALGAGTVVTMNAGTPFTVLSGPSCNSGYNWWRVQISGGRSGWVAEATWDTYYIQPVLDVTPTGCNAASSPWARLFLSPICYFTQ